MIYLDNAATSWPKPPEVLRAVNGVMSRPFGNPGRGGHRASLCAGRVVIRLPRGGGQVSWLRP